MKRWTVTIQNGAQYYTCIQQMQGIHQQKRSSRIIFTIEKSNVSYFSKLELYYIRMWKIVYAKIRRIFFIWLFSFHLFVGYVYFFKLLVCHGRNKFRNVRDLFSISNKYIFFLILMISLRIFLPREIICLFVHDDYEIQLLQCLQCALCIDNIFDLCLMPNVRCLFHHLDTMP